MLHVTRDHSTIDVTCNNRLGLVVGTQNVNTRVQRHRDSLRKAGLRPVQIWVPDTRLPGFAEECRRQALVAAAADASDPDLNEFMDRSLEDIGFDDNNRTC